MNDQDEPTSIEHAANEAEAANTAAQADGDLDATGQPPPAEPRPLKCLSCNKVIPPDEAIERERAGKEFLGHRISVRNGPVIESKICGPLVKALVFQVWFKVQEEGKAERTRRTVLSGIVAPEEDWEVVSDWERYLEGELAATGMEARPTVVVDRWELAGTK